VIQAIAQREGARAEALMREHSHLAQRNLREALQSPLHLLGAHLISPSS
jgi:GntR family transcriptional regulator of vanillate catabolism